MGKCGNGIKGINPKNFGNHLVAFFGSDCRLSAIGKLDCERFKNQYLGKLAACTASHGLRACRTIFKYAVDAGWLENNPFNEVTSRVDVNLEGELLRLRDWLLKRYGTGKQAG